MQMGSICITFAPEMAINLPWCYVTGLAIMGCAGHRWRENWKAIKINENIEVSNLDAEHSIRREVFDAYIAVVKAFLSK